MKKRHLYPLLFATLFISAAMSLMVGDVTVNIFAVLDWLGDRLGGSATEEGAFYKILFEQIRGPRIVLAAMTGFVFYLSKFVAHALFWPP
jgi:ABC-type Fe3+-siderophore transport system permease subunit